MIHMNNLDAELKQMIAGAYGILGVSRLSYLAKPGSSGYTYAWLMDNKNINPELIHTDTWAAYRHTTTYRNDVIMVAPDSHTWVGDNGVAGAALTWAKSCTHMIGMAPFSKGGGMRSRFGHSGYTMANFVTISGHSNLWANLYFMHGSSTGGASDVTTLTVSGARNVFKGCHFAGPNDQTQASSANYKQLVLSGTQNYFKDCSFGGFNAIHRDAANCILNLPASGGQGNVFEDCIFWSRTADTDPYFINMSGSTTGGCWRAIFLNCQFINMTPLHGSYAMAVAIASTPTEGDENYLFFDNRCTFAGCTDIIANGKEGIVVWGGAGANPDTTAIGDDKALGLAQNPEQST